METIVALATIHRRAVCDDLGLCWPKTVSEWLQAVQAPLLPSALPLHYTVLAPQAPLSCLATGFQGQKLEEGGRARDTSSSSRRAVEGGTPSLGSLGGHSLTPVGCLQLKL